MSTCGVRRMLVTCVVVLAAARAGSAGQRLSRGHDILLRKGLQIQALASPRVNGRHANYMEHFAESGFTSVDLGPSYEDYVNYLGPPEGVPWAKWHAPWDRDFELTEIELPHAGNMISYHYCPVISRIMATGCIMWSYRFRDPNHRKPVEWAFSRRSSRSGSAELCRGSGPNEAVSS